jgi:hypothetical protein
MSNTGAAPPPITASTRSNKRLRGKERKDATSPIPPSIHTDLTTTTATTTLDSAAISGTNVADRTTNHNKRIRSASAYVAQDGKNGNDNIASKVFATPTHDGTRKPRWQGMCVSQIFDVSLKYYSRKLASFDRC